MAPLRTDVAATRTPMPGYWVPGERMLWHLEFKGVALVRAMLAVGQPGVLGGLRTLIVKTRLEPMSVVAAIADFRIEMQSWIDLAPGKPTRLEFDAVLPDEHNRGVVLFHPGAIESTLWRGDRPPRTRKRTLEPGARSHDVHTLLAVLRGFSAKPGEHVELVHFDDDRMRRHIVRLTRYELFDSEAVGRVPAARLDGLIFRSSSAGKGRPYTVWISDDARRLPLRIEMPTRHGPVRLDLVEYDDPKKRSI